MFLDSLKKHTSKTYTENGAETYNTSGNALLDFFAVGGACRDNLEQALVLFKKAYKQDKQAALRTLFYLRDVRGGQGERDVFRLGLRYVFEEDYPSFLKVHNLVAEYGRWDDLFEFAIEDSHTSEYLRRVLLKDAESDSPSLLAKWLPTINASSPNTRRKAVEMAKAMVLEHINYRRIVRGIRKKIRTVEEQMSAKKWSDIEYEKVPSVANKKYAVAFLKHDEERRKDYILSVLKGENRMNASALYPYQIYDMVQDGVDSSADALWKSLPDYTNGDNALVVADVSGSMMGRPMSISVSLALYFAERNTGTFANHFITFSENPSLQEVTGNTLSERMRNIETTGWGYNTDVGKVFEAILNAAVEANTPQEEMPKIVYIISDMEFDEADTGSTNHEQAKKMFEEKGYVLPTLVYWNVDSRETHYPVYEDEVNTYLVSGASPVTFRVVFEGKTPVEVMESVINSERYQKIII
jgi:hypothetical protein